MAHWQSQLFFQFLEPRQPLIALATLKMIDARNFQGFTGGELARLLFDDALLIPLAQAIRAAEPIGLQLALQAIAPARRDFIESQVLAAFGEAINGIRGHRHSVNPLYTEYPPRRSWREHSWRL